MAFNLEDAGATEEVPQGRKRAKSPCPAAKRKVKYDPLQRIGVGMSRLGTSEAVAIGAYAFALRKLDQK